MTLALIRHDARLVGVTETAPQGIGPLQWFHTHCRAYSMDHALAHEGYSVEEVEDIDCHDVAGMIDAICEHNGVTMDSEFVPFSVSRNSEEDRPSLNWKITIKRHGREVLRTDYGQGYGHAPASKLKAPGKMSGRYAEQLRMNAIRAECETGMRHRFGEYGSLFGRDGTMNTRAAITPPAIGEVMQSLISDSDVLDYGGFDDWAENYGYDPDSRKAESIYRACVEIATKLRAGLGQSLIEEIRLVAQFN